MNRERLPLVFDRILNGLSFEDVIVDQDALHVGDGLCSAAITKTALLVVFMLGQQGQGLFQRGGNIRDVLNI